jgi:hypothetical protein
VCGRRTPRAVAMAGTLKNSMSGEAGEAFIDDTSHQRPEQMKSTALLWENSDPYVPAVRASASAASCCGSAPPRICSQYCARVFYPADRRHRAHRDRAGLRYGPKAAAHLTVRRFQEALVNKEVSVGSLWEERAVRACAPIIFVPLGCLPACFA